MGCFHSLLYDSIDINDIYQNKYRTKSSIVQTSKGNKIYTKEEFNTLDQDGKIETVYGTRMKQGGGEMKVCCMYMYVSVYMMVYFYFYK